MKKKTLNIIKNDPWLEPYTDAIVGRHNDALAKEAELCGSEGTLDTFANAHNFFGLHRTADGGWVFREWAPNATAINLIGDFSKWKLMKNMPSNRRKTGCGKSNSNRPISITATFTR